MNQPTRSLTRAPGFVGRKVAGEFVLVPTGSGGVAGVGPSGVAGLDFLVLNPTAEGLWHQLADWRTPEDLARHLTATYSISIEEAQADVDQFVEALAHLGAIRERGTE
ncbi:MAG: hypothetical protein NVS1B4_08120 [Gemmatimonadaceae bacterium]